MEPLDFIINHIVLPPKLPQQEDGEENEREGQCLMLRLIRERAACFAMKCCGEVQRAWRPVLRALENMESLTTDMVCKANLERILGELEPSGAVALHVKAQNAALLIHRPDHERVLVHAFETSARCDAVMQTSDRLVWLFPGQSVTFNASFLIDAHFVRETAIMLSNMCLETAHICMPTTKKGGSKVPEERETVHPGFVTEGLMSVLEALGEAEKAPAIHKHIRDDVNWYDSKLPWRRSPFWLAIRVSIQILLDHSLPGDEGRNQYKNFMAFLMAEVLDVTMDNQIGADVQLIVMGKAARRLSKLGNDGLDFVEQAVQASVQSARDHLERVWKEFQEKEARPIPRCNRSATEQDRSLALRKTRKHLQEVMARNKGTAKVHEIVLSEAERLRLDSDGLPTLAYHDEELQGIFQLTDFERWILEELRQWILDRAAREQDCASLMEMMRKYIDMADGKYKGNPRAQSVMLLVLLEIWTVLDTICLKLYPMLAHHDPGIPKDIGDPLLLPHLCQLESLKRIEDHLAERWREATPGYPPIHGPLMKNSFGVRFFDQSEAHKQLQATIEKDATARRERKKEEWNEKNVEYQRLREEESRLSCSYGPNYYGDNVHLSSCPKCYLQDRIKYFCILLDEWPLPKDPVPLKAAVFELDCPLGVSAWRDATWMILQDIGNPKTLVPSDAKERLLTYAPLKKYAVNRNQRITLASHTKSFLKAHYHELPFPTSLDNVCVNNGLQYAVFDGMEDLWVKDQNSPTFHPRCISRLPPGPYSNLQEFVNTTSHTSNEAQAGQQQCHPGISPHEYLAFAALRSGERIQWLNILRELASSGLSFNAQAVHILIRQAALQAGARGAYSVLREAHAQFYDSAFNVQLLDLLEEHLIGIEANWKEQNRLSTLAHLALRLLSLGPPGPVTGQAVKLLRKLRDVALHWCRQVSEILQISSSENESLKLRTTILNSATTAHLTFDLDLSRASLILEDSRDVANFVESSVHLHDNLPVSPSDIPDETRHALLMARRITRDIEDRLRTLIRQENSGIGDGIERACGLTGFQGDWDFCAGTRNRWATCEVATESGNTHPCCHYDLLTGEVLLDGRPIGRLPSAYTSTSVYRRTFGSRILNVTKSHLPDMEYKTPTRIDGHEIHLCMRNGELLVETLEREKHFRLVPHDSWGSDLPRPLTEDFIHWINLSTGDIFFRPLENPFMTCGDTSILHFRSNGRSNLEIGGRELVDHDSQLGQSITSILRVLEDPLQIIITASQDTVEAEVPRFRLKFAVNEDGSLESKELNAVVDEDQHIGCLFGLCNKLAVRSVGSHPSIHERSVVIPYGSLSVSGSGDYKLVQINTSTDRKRQLMHYQIDEKLSQLRSSQGGAIPLLFLAYLHAITGSILPDPLTGHTGTQEAIRILRQQSLRTASPITVHEMTHLNDIASLTPSREFYPKHLQSMQTVKWRPDVSQLAQHEDFYTLSEEIVAHSAQFSILHTGQTDPLDLESRGNADLLRRATNCNWSVRTTSLGTRERCDKRYSTRDAETQSDRARCVHEIAGMVLQWPNKIDVVQNLVQNVRKWERIDYGHALNPSELTCNDMLGIQLDQQWGSLYNFCKKSQREADQYRLMYLLGMVAFAQPKEMLLLQTLLGIASSGLFSNISPSGNSYDLGFGESPVPSKIRSDVQKHYADCVRRHRENQSSWSERLMHRSQQLSRIVDHVLLQWPCNRPTLPPDLPLVDRDRASDACTTLFTKWNENRKFIRHVEEVQSRLHQIYCGPVGMAGRVASPEHQFPVRGPSTIVPTLMDLLHDRLPPSLPMAPEGIHMERMKKAAESLQGLEELQEIVNEMRSSSDTTRKTYADDLSSSLTAFTANEFPETPAEIAIGDEQLRAHRAEIAKSVDIALRSITEALLPDQTPKRVLYKAGLWPRITVQSLLSFLSASKIRKTPNSWKKALVSLGEMVSLLQRSERLLALKHRNDIVGFYKEAEEPGRRSWYSAEFPDWLLIEVENNLTIRELQAVVARTIVRPHDEKNFVLQLNMGEGKSSVIVPMVMTALSNGTQLARLIVLKPLLRQTENLLSQRLGGLVDRQICHMPFSRNTRLDKQGISQLRSILIQCMQEQSILIALPEHLMSFRLMGREHLSTEPELGWSMIALDGWLGANCRDVLDESDEILDPRFQVVYSMGGQRMMDGQPDRWFLTQRLLFLFGQQAQRLFSEGHRSLEVDYRDRRSYPSLIFLDSAVGQTLLDLVVGEIGEGNLIGVTLNRFHGSVRQAALTFIRNRSITDDVGTTVMEAFKGTEVWDKLHLLRGLIAYDVLLFAFQNKRWLVNYGLDLSRCMMAVPYRAKGVSSLSAEFSHPDVAIVLTCLSYYYVGLTSAQLRQSFDILFRESDPSSEYSRWVQDCPRLAIRSLDGVNLEDELSWEAKLYPNLRFSRSAADFFMSRVVFPREGKEFPAKLSSSAWDIPSLATPNGTSGFSGTNDNKFLLPTSIRQQDLPQLHHTNAMVVNLLLWAENRGYIAVKHSISVRGLLQIVCSQNPHIQVLIDVGAQVLESRNSDVAKEWLELSPHTNAAVYFDESDEVMAVDRQGYAQRLCSSPFRQKIAQCVIYLDEVHTRGVDLGLPMNARAAVTLGPRTTKDRLVQACMRMRKLGCYQSLVFFSPPEVHQEILRITGKRQDDTLDSGDVVRWCLQQTCRASDNIKPLWIMQGLEHSRRKRLCATLSAVNILEDAPLLEEGRASSFCFEIQEPEGRPLEEMYGFRSEKAVFRECLTDQEARQDPTVQSLLSLWDSFNDKTKDWTLQEEQEREIAQEVEQEREVQRPPPASALPHRTHPEVRRFVKSGTFNAKTSTKSPFLGAFRSLQKSSAYQNLHAQAVAEDLYVTSDFFQTVEETPQMNWDEFMRPVQWILSSCSMKGLVIISPHEANDLILDIRASSKVRLHVYSAKISKTMREFSNLRFYTVSSCDEEYIPDPLLTAQLNLFAGCLFFKGFPE